MEEITPEQNSQLGSWAKKRDTVLAEISVAQIEKEKLERENTALAGSTKDIDRRIGETIGRMDELNKREKEYESTVSAELADLTSQKTGLQADVSALKADIELLTSKKDLLTQTISSLTDVHEKVFARASNLDKTVADITRINSQNIREVEILLGSLRETTKQMVDLNNQTIAEANKVTIQLPQIVFELQKKLLERKTIHDIPRQ